MTRSSPRDRYAQHRASARERGIAFDLTFEEWWEIWEPHFAKRGVSSGAMQMCRNGDVGAYAPGNVRIASHAENCDEATAASRRKALEDSWPDGSSASWIMDRGLFCDDYFTTREKVESDDAFDGQD
jgi:hypothetical protein